MSALAKLMLSHQKKVYGSDMAKSKLTLQLETLGAKIYYNQTINHIPKNCDLVVYTGAVNEDCPEIQFAQTNNISLVSRADFLSLVSQLYENTIAISGTHGKTTTTALIGEIFKRAGLKPTVHVGGEVIAFHGNLLIGDNKYFITEACEYKRSFESMNSNSCVITNIEEDHMDCYKNLDDIKNSFLVFAKKSSNVFTFAENDLNPVLCKTKNIITCGMAKCCDFFVTNITCNQFGNYSFDVVKNQQFFGSFKLNLMGEYNIMNAIYAIAVCDYYGISKDVIASTLKEFKGIKRRNELIGSVKNVPVFADYSHHPTEILKSITSFKQIYKKVLVVFQPHTYSRTKALLNEFKFCFKNANKLIIYKTYPARELPIEGGDASNLFSAVKICNKNKFYCISPQALDYLLKENAESCNVILVLGAGDLYDVVKNLNYKC